jgi:hypothetical protein
MKTLSITFIVAVFALVLLWPLAAIWAVNTLFGFAIAYTFWNWLAVIVLVAFFGKSSLRVEK